MMTIADVISHWAHSWRNLAAWGAPLPATLDIKPHEGQRRLGRAYYATRCAEVLITGALHEDLGTVLHELAHLAAPDGTKHGKHWREIYVRAVAEAFGVDKDIFDIEVKITALDAQVRHEAQKWLVRSGQLVVLRALGVS